VFLSIVALVVYIVKYYYFMDVNLLDKSILLMITGSILLVLRYILEFVFRGKNYA